jgi:hypothetical protein
LLILTTEACKTFIIACCPFEWKGTLTMKAPTATRNMSGHRLLWTAGEPCRWQSRTTKSTGDWLESGSLLVVRRSTEHCIVSQSTRTRKAANQRVSRHPSRALQDRMNITYTVTTPSILIGFLHGFFQRKSVIHALLTRPYSPSKGKTTFKYSTSKCRTRDTSDSK